MSELIHDKRQPELLWPGERVPCPKCGGARMVRHTQQNARSVPHTIIGGQRVTCPACGGRGKVRMPSPRGS